MLADLFNLSGMIHLDERNTTDSANVKKTYNVYNSAFQTENPSGTFNSSSRRSAGPKKSAFNLPPPKSSQDMTKDEKILLKETEDEFKRKGSFHRVFPCIDFVYYKQFFEEDRPLNYFLDS